MRTQRATLEVIAPTVEEATEKGLTDLGLPLEAVEIEILDEGSRGLFGLGTRQARIRLTVVAPGDGETEQPAPAPAKPELLPTPAEEPAATDEEDEEDELEPARRTSPRQQFEADLTLEITQQVVAELLEHMKINAEVTTSYGEKDDKSGIVPVLADIHGDDLSVLIGKRSETLNALQFIARQIASKELGAPVTLVIDVEGYRARRERQLRQLASRMADQAIKTGRKQTLEPMTPAERRIIHMELRDHPDVTTQSFGEEPYRKVTILPKE